MTLRKPALFNEGVVDGREIPALKRLGWNAFFAQQIDTDELTKTPPARVVAVHRNGLRIVGESVDDVILPVPEATVGDWSLVDPASSRVSRILERKSLIKRRAPGTGREMQLIAANIDTVFIITSCNADFNVARLERYVALVFEARIEPVILLTKADLTDDTETYIKGARSVSDRVSVVALDARGTEPAQALAGWSEPGHNLYVLVHNS